MWGQFTPLKIDGKEENLHLTLHPSQGQQNVYFFQAIIYFTIFIAIIVDTVIVKKSSPKNLLADSW